MGPSSTAFPLCFSSKCHRHPLCPIKSQGVSGGGPVLAQLPPGGPGRLVQPSRLSGPQSCFSIPPPGRLPTPAVFAVEQGAAYSSSASGRPQAGRERWCGTDNRPREGPFGSLETWVLGVALPCPPRGMLVSPFSLLASVCPSVRWGGETLFCTRLVQGGVLV